VNTYNIDHSNSSSPTLSHI